MLFHQDNAPVDTSVFTVAKAKELRFEFHPQASHLPDLDSSDYFLHLNSKKCLGGKRSAKVNRWSLQIMAILRSLMVLAINRASELFDITGENVLTYKGRLLRNKDFSHIFYASFDRLSTSGTILLLSCFKTSPFQSQTFEVYNNSMRIRVKNISCNQNICQ